MTLGAGFFSAGFGYAGTGLTPPTPEQPGATPGASFINQNGNYQTDGTGDTTKTTHTAQRALNLIRMTFGSSTVETALGLKAPLSFGASFERAMKNAVESALAPMTDDSTIRIDKIEVSKTNSIRCAIVLHYTVLDTGTTEIVRI